MKDIFEIQSEIAHQVASSLEVRLLADERKMIKRKPTKNREAHILFLKGLYCDENGYSENDFAKAINYFEKAIEQDPTYAVAYCWLADCYTTLVRQGFVRLDQILQKAERAVAKALELEPDLGDAYVNLGFVRSMQFDWISAEEEIKRGLKIDPNVIVGHAWLAWYNACLGRTEQAAIEVESAMKLDPLNYVLNKIVATVYYCENEYDKAIDQLQKMRLFYSGSLLLDIAINLGLCYFEKSEFDKAVEEFQRACEPTKGKADHSLSYLAAAYARSGRIDEAKKMLQDFKEVSKTQFVPFWTIAIIQTALGESNEAIETLERAYQARDWVTLQGLVDSHMYDMLRSDPRFKGLLKKFGFPIIQRKKRPEQYPLILPNFSTHH
jgi:tetratricopeptide (TPR) repeat protein